MNMYVYVKYRRKKKEIEKKWKQEDIKVNFIIIRKFGNREIIMDNHKHFWY